VSSSLKQKQLKLLGLRIKKLRQASGISCNQLAFEIGTSEKYLRRLEKGELNFGVFKLYQLAEILDIDVKEFFN
jgi:transcriptional regulator with XRE-family HTH domain